MNRRWLAAVGFAFHLPGLRLFAGYRADRALLVTNAWALGLTLLAMVAALLYPPIWRRWAVISAWAVGHFGWSIFLARHLLNTNRT